MESKLDVPQLGESLAAGSAPIEPAPGSLVRRRSALPIALVVGGLATLVTWGCGEVLANWFRPELIGNATLGPLHGGATLETSDHARVLNAALVYGIQGATLGLALAMLGGLIRDRSSQRSLLAASLVGLGLGGLVAAISSLVVFPIYLRLVDPLSDDLLRPMLAHAAIWVPMGAVAGLAFALAYGHSSARMVFAGVMGAAFGTMFYEIIGALCFPLAQTGEPIAATIIARLLAHASVNGLVSLVVVRARLV